MEIELFLSTVNFRFFYDTLVVVDYNLLIEVYFCFRYNVNTFNIYTSNLATNELWLIAGHRNIKNCDNMQKSELKLEIFKPK